MLPFSSVRLYITRKYNRAEELQLSQFCVRRLNSLICWTSVLVPAYYAWLTLYASLYWNFVIDSILCVTHTTCLPSLYLSDSLHIMRDSHFIRSISLQPSDSLYIMHDSHIICFNSANLTNILFIIHDSHLTCLTSMDLYIIRDSHFLSLH